LTNNTIFTNFNLLYLFINYLQTYRFFHILLLSSKDQPYQSLQAPVYKILPPNRAFHFHQPFLVVNFSISLISRPNHGHRTPHRIYCPGRHHPSNFEPNHGKPITIDQRCSFGHTAWPRWHHRSSRFQ